MSRTCAPGPSLLGKLGSLDMSAWSYITTCVTPVMTDSWSRRGVVTEMMSIIDARASGQFKATHAEASRNLTSNAAMLWWLQSGGCPSCKRTCPGRLGASNFEPRSSGIHRYLERSPSGYGINQYFFQIQLYLWDVFVRSNWALCYKLRTRDTAGYDQLPMQRVPMLNRGKVAGGEKLA